MNDSFPSANPSIEGLLRQYLPVVRGDQIPRLPVYRSLRGDGILYRCPLQYRFSLSRRREIARRFLSFPLATVTLTADGWLEVFLDDRGLSLWLQGFQGSIDQLFPVPPRRPSNPIFSFLFQYTHARCCSLLRLGEREGILIGEKGGFRPYHPVERALFLQLLTVVDRAQIGKARSLAMDLCESILDLDRSCRIIGEPVEVARSRLQLISVSQQLLRSLLVSRFAFTPIEDF